jgi:hypothetical protein
MKSLSIISSDEAERLEKASRIKKILSERVNDRNVFKIENYLQSRCLQLGADLIEYPSCNGNCYVFYKTMENAKSFS